MQFLADMGVALAVVNWLRQLGHDAKHLREEGLQRLPDSQVFTKAGDEKRIILTFDLDFGEILALSGQRSVSVVLFRLHNTRTDQVIARLQKVLEDSSNELEQGAIVIVEEARHRVRLLPITKKPE